MNKTYRKDGNNSNVNSKRVTYCKEHFIEKYGREPNILDTVHFLPCSSMKCLGCVNNIS